MPNNNHLFAREEKWEPVSEWGRNFKAYLASQNIVLVTEKPKPKRVSPRRKPRQRVIRPMKSYVLCACGKRLRNRNTTGKCKVCQRNKDWKICPAEGCNQRLNANCKYGYCEFHSRSIRKSAYEARKKAAA